MTESDAERAAREKLEAEKEALAKGATIADLIDMRSSLEAQLLKMNEMLMALLKSKEPEATSPSPPSKEHGENSKESSSDGSKDVPPSASPEKAEKDESPSSSNTPEGEEYHEVNHNYSPNPPIPHPHVNFRSDPPKLKPTHFSQWQFQMKSHLCSVSIELWRIIEDGFKAHDPTNLTRREVFDSQLNATALHQLQMVVGEDMPLIKQFSTTKEVWNAISDIFVGNESMKKNRYDALCNEVEGFYKLDGESHEDMYRRLVLISNTFKNLGAVYIDDAWIKRKFVTALLPFEETDLKKL